MSNPASRGKPLATPPREVTIWRRARSFMSSPRRQVMRRASRSSSLSPIDVVVDHGGEQVVGRADGVEIAREVEVDVLHGHHLRIAPAGRPALEAEARPQARLAQADHGLLADAPEAVAQAHGGRRLALARGRGGDGGDQDQLALGAALEGIDMLERHLGLVAAVALERAGRDPSPSPISSTGLIFASRAISMSDLTLPMVASPLFPLRFGPVRCRRGG